MKTFPAGPAASASEFVSQWTSSDGRLHSDGRPQLRPGEDSLVGSSLAEPAGRHVLPGIKQQLLTCHSLRDALQIIADSLRQQIRTPLIAWYSAAGSQVGDQPRLESLVCPIDGIAGPLRQQLLTAATVAVTQNRIVVQPLGGQPQLFIVASSLQSPPDHCLLAILESANAPGASSPELLQFCLAAALLEEWSSRQALDAAHQESSALAALIEIISRTHAAGDVRSACQRLADQLREYLHADSVFVGLSGAQPSEPRLLAISGEQNFDPLAESTRLTEAVLHESIARTVTGIWPAVDPQNRHALLSHQQLADFLGCRWIVSVPLMSENGQSAGAIAVTFGHRNHEVNIPQTSDSVSDTTLAESGHSRALHAERILRAGAGALTSCLQVVQRLADSRWIEFVRGSRRLLTTQKFRSAATLLIASSLALLIPVSYRIPCKVELQPVERRYVAAPFSGPLEQCLVEPGDVVEASQLLARMDAREIQWELAGVRADLHKATKERNTHLSAHAFGDAAIARYEVERLQTRNEMLQHRDSSLDIRSPVSGLIVSGKHRETEGVTLEQGQTLFEVAPLDRMLVEVSIPEEDLRHVRAGMQIRIQLDAAPEQTFKATLTRVHPRAELKDNENVFIGEAELDNQQLFLRPGMRGTARVIAEPRAIGWIWLHKPLAHLVGWLGW